MALLSTIGVAALDDLNANGTGAMFIPSGTTAQRPTGTTSTGALRYNTSVASLELYTPAGWGNVFSGQLGTQTNPATSGPALYAALGAVGSGLYWFRNSAGAVQQLYCDLNNGGWVMVASNNASDTTIAGGTGRYSSSYYLNRAGAGALGTPSPDSDYLIGGFLDSFTFSNARILAWGRGSTNGSTSYAGNRGTYIDATWPLTTSGTSRYSEVVLRGNVTLGGNSSFYSAAGYFVLDSIYVDFINGGFTANANQISIGAAGVAGSSGDPTTGCYTGHGSTEGSYEGWYDAGGGNADCQGYTTWVR